MALNIISASNSAILISFSIIISMTLATDSYKELFLTPMIKNNQSEEARNKSFISPDFFNVKSYSGFLTVDETFNSNLFFWYFPVADRDLFKTPWIIWLQGGPGATSLFGLFKEVGPFRYNNGIEMRETSWCKNYSMVFIDNPVGAGFSFTDNDEGYPEDIEQYSNHLYIAVKQLVTVYPELSRAPLYIAGESYAGRYVPGLGMKILDEQNNGMKIVNLQGLIMGNPTLDRDSAMDYTSAFYHWGMIDAQEALAAKPLQDEFKKAIQDRDPIKTYDLRDQLLDKLQDMSYKMSTYNALKSYTDLSDFSEFVTRPDIRLLIHVGRRPFDFSSLPVHTHLRKDTLASVSPKIEKILEQCKILIYCGQLDLTTPCVQNAEARRKKWHWSRRDNFLMAPRVPWIYNRTLAGYVKSGGGFTEVSLTGAGHLVGIDKPAELRQLVIYFIEGIEVQPPGDYRNYDVVEYQEYTPEETDRGVMVGLIASSLVNVLLLMGLVISIVLLLRYKKHFYASLSTNEDIITLEYI